MSKPIEYSLSPNERPRERMMLYGRDGMADVELLALVLGGGHALPRAFELLRAFGGLVGLDHASPWQLCEIPGIGVAGATAICGALELGQRTARLGLQQGVPLRRPEDVADFARATLGNSEQEQFVVLGLDSRLCVRTVRRIAMGNQAQVSVQPREVFRPLVRDSIHAVILVHNHPSGQLAPSEADFALTRRLEAVGDLVGIPVLDHIVVTRNDFASLGTWREGDSFGVFSIRNPA